MSVDTDRSYTVEGMTCGHCRLSVIEEVSEVDGVDSVEVELDTGKMTVHGSVLSDDAICAAVEEAGYSLADGR